MSNFRLLVLILVLGVILGLLVIGSVLLALR